MSSQSGRRVEVSLARYIPFDMTWVDYSVLRVEKSVGKPEREKRNGMDGMRTT
jgi:hypothetical protein